MRVEPDKPIKLPGGTLIGDHDPEAQSDVPNDAGQASTAAQGREVVTVHECAECGYIEGESPQAGCCPRCGIKSDAIPMKVRRV